MNGQSFRTVAECVSYVRHELAAEGYAYLSAFPCDDAGTQLLELARALGTVYAPPGVSPDAPLIETSPSPDADERAPFDRREAIGWHNDFSTHADRPNVSLAYLARPDPGGEQFGAWRVASWKRVVERLNSCAGGRSALRFLNGNDIPFVFSDDDEPAFLRCAVRGPKQEIGSLRFYGRTMRQGCRVAYGAVSNELEHAIAAVEAAADTVGCTLPAPAGALLVTDNWTSLHDRLSQTVVGNAPFRRSVLCFVQRMHP